MSPGVVVIGAGFSGTALAVQLLRRLRAGRVLLINRFGPIGQGVAYRTTFETHLLNVPAAGMSALPDDPEHFLRWLRARRPGVEGAEFVSRRLFGEYLTELLHEAAAAAAGRVHLDRVVDEAESVEPTAHVPGAIVRLRSGTSLDADAVVLALGNYAPRNLDVDDGGLYGTDRYVRDPWTPGSLDVIRPGETVLLIGTGLTMLDMALDISERSRSAPLHAVSRHGLLPQPHRPPSPGAPRPPIVRLTDRTRLGPLVRALRDAAREHARQGGDWRDVVGAVRAETPALWRGLSGTERRRFLRHARTYWDVHRHRAAPETFRAVEARIAAGQVQVHAARIVGFRIAPAGVDVDLRPRGTRATRTLRVARVVNATGPDGDVSRIDDRLLRGLTSAGLVRPDPLHLGLDVDVDGRLLDSSGTPTRGLWLLGPMLRGRDWEATAVPELRRLAAELAERLARDLG